MELLWSAVSSSAVICWLGAQLIFLALGLRDPERPRGLIRQGLSVLSTVLYLVAVILLIQLGFEGRWELLLAVLGLVILLTVGFGLLRYFLFRRSSRPDRSQPGKESDVHPR